LQGGHYHHHHRDEEGGDLDEGGIGEDAYFEESNGTPAGPNRVPVQSSEALSPSVPRSHRVGGDEADAYAAPSP